ncbi:hypothetical protein CISIN_1g046484mg [Citrus sinensis]|uniref:Ubiquitin-like protease family profile domain-containing protein n=1 Tax=Citrus sinensis TaxID=2711 RepID=A0A067CZE0_CITSI|nr:hypothetical protein CISIN_1g046484mg [Citrus sinensis]
MSTLLPGEWIDGDVIVAAYYAYYLEPIITMYAYYKNMKEAEKDVTSPRCWFLPTYYSQVALADWSSLNFAQAAGFRDRYMGRLDTCEKIYVPINCDGHWYMLLVDISHATATIWDSLESPSRRKKIINESSEIHDLDHARLLLALYLLQSPLNKIMRRLIQEARKL